jgi:hypothetical protein
MSHNELQGDLSDISGLDKFETLLGQGTALANNRFSCPLPHWAAFATPCISGMRLVCSRLIDQATHHSVTQLIVSVGYWCIGSVDISQYRLHRGERGVGCIGLWSAGTRHVQILRQTAAVNNRGNR